MVRKHIENIYKKLQVHNKAETIEKAVDLSGIMNTKCEYTKSIFLNLLAEIPLKPVIFHPLLIDFPLHLCKKTLLA